MVEDKQITSHIQLHWPNNHTPRFDWPINVLIRVACNQTSNAIWFDIVQNVDVVDRLVALFYINSFRAPTLKIYSTVDTLMSTQPDRFFLCPTAIWLQCNRPITGAEGSYWTSDG
jgi:hypothetical protein